MFSFLFLTLDHFTKHDEANSVFLSSPTTTTSTSSPAAHPFDTMYGSRKDSSEYVPLATHQDGGSSEDVDSPVGSPTLVPRPKARLPQYLLWTSVLVALLSLVNLVLLPKTILHYELSEAALAKLPYPDLHIGFSRIEKLLHDTLPRPYIHSWPTHIARINEGLKNTVYGNSLEVFVSVRVSFLILSVISPFLIIISIAIKDSTLMRFTVPEGSADQSCAVGWKGPVETRVQDLTTKGDISEIEIWSIIHDSAFDLDFDAVSWGTRPVRGELLGTLDLKSSLANATTEKFRCPSQDKFLVVEFRCVRVDCQVSFSQIKDVHPNMGNFDSRSDFEYRADWMLHNRIRVAQAGALIGQMFWVLVQVLRLNKYIIYVYIIES
ncbi:hypothetical protein D9758_009351 [Tetrapyrgos nigripes]|uniref:Uncharacterized protein n=1 Tax=Tetrapyrgos nigripes TaxID=182062 RepID=A0A8H5LPL5_9AGAR|nr:hypothetical protein D9758_009351 [Tetrapyrgos nigripes]